MRMQYFFVAFAIFSCSCSENKAPNGFFFGRCAVSPEGRALYFAMGDRSASNLYSVANDGSRLAQMTAGAGIVRYDPCASPDGKWITFAANLPGAKGHIYVAERGGTDIRQLTFGDSWDGVPSYSPDGKKIIFARSTPCSGNDIWEMNADGTSVRQLTHNQYYGVDAPYVSPDGKQIIFAADVGEPFKNFSHRLLIFNIREDGTATSPTAVPLPPGPYDQKDGRNFDGDPYFSRDGSHICFISLRESRRSPYDYEIWTSKLDGTELRQITHDQSRDEHPVFSPDMKYIYYGSDSGELWQLDIVNKFTKRVVPMDTYVSAVGS